MSINGLCTENWPLSQQTQQRTKLMKIYWFGDKNRANSSNFNAMILKLSEKFDHPFLHLFIFGNMFPESRFFCCASQSHKVKTGLETKPWLSGSLLRVTISLLCPLQAVSMMHVPIYPNLSEGRRNCSTLWPAQQWNRDSGNMLPNMSTCENGWSKFSENLKIVILKLLELTRFASPTQLIYFHFVRVGDLLWCWHF